MAECSVCRQFSPFIASAIRVCRRCLLERPEDALIIVRESHARARTGFGLPPSPPKSSRGVACNLCAAACVIPEGGVGYCGIRGARGGRMWSLSGTDYGLLSYYLDPHVTNCCNAWFCPAGTGCGYPRYAARDGPELGYYNLALFFYGCSFNCLFCQNWNHKMLKMGRKVTTRELVDLTLSNDKITCWCWFGGSAEPQLPFAVNSSRKLLELKGDKICRICWEWNGDGNPALVKRAGEQALVSGGNVKFDLKAFDSPLHIALTGMPNEATLRNFELIYREFYNERRDVPVLGATTLLVPHYVDEEEVSSIAKFIAELDDTIPYNLLVFHPDFMMRDLPITPERQVLNCYKAAKKYLRRVTVSNLHLLAKNKYQ
jgi:pyruvate formate lyase activating enzyme